MNVRTLSLAIAGLLTYGFINAANAAQGSGCLPTTGTVSGLSLVQGINSAIAALISGNSGSSQPTTDCTAAPVKGQVWLDTSVTPNVEKRFDGVSWVSVGAIDSSGHVWVPPVGGGSATVTAATTTDICANPASMQAINGTTAITGFGSACPTGVRKTLLFNAATPITYNATSMILPGQRDYIAAAGDMGEALHLGSGNWRVSISRIDGTSVLNPSVPLGTVLYGLYGSVPAKTVYGMGQALSRSSYPDYFAAATRVQTGTLTSGNNTITSVSDTGGLGAGMPLEGTGIQSGATISSVTSSTIVMSATATANGSQSVRAFVTGYGSGGDSTTVGVPNCKGAVMAGRDDMGGTAANRLTTSYFGAGNRLNTFGGVQGAALPLSALPNVNLPLVGIAPGAPVPLDTIPGVDLLYNNGTGAIGPTAGSITPGTIALTSLKITLPAPAGNTRLNGNQAQTGTSATQPTVIAECVVAVLP